MFDFAGGEVVWPTAAEVFRLSDTHSVEERTVADGDMFIFDFDQVFV